MEYSTTQTEEAVNWWTNNSLSEEYIREYGEAIFANPASVSTTADNTQERLYSEEQLMEMFRLGYITMTRTDIGQKIIKAKCMRMNRPYVVLRNMDVGTKTKFPNCLWSTVRVAASSLKREFDCQFRVRKLGPRTENGDIEVIRVR